MGVCKRPWRGRALLTPSPIPLLLSRCPSPLLPPLPPALFLSSSEQVATRRPGGRPAPGPEQASTLTLDFSASGTVGNTFLWFKSSSHGHSAWQPEQREREGEEGAVSLGTQAPLEAGKGRTDTPGPPEAGPADPWTLGLWPLEL